MTRFETRWVEHAARQLDALPSLTRDAVIARIAQLEADDDPGRFGTYNAATDTYTTDFRDDGFITFAVVADRFQIIVLRVVAV